ncbi:MAG: hypothetical protein GC134_07275 [Proteobacteria bacterium]|nr:hypothetical protein [Pseudomonadota bacterium]
MALFHSAAAVAQVTPGYVPPVTVTTTPYYADDTRGIYVPPHQQHRLMTEQEQKVYLAQVQYGMGEPAKDEYENELNRIAGDQGQPPMDGGMPMQMMPPPGGQTVAPMAPMAPMGVPPAMTPYPYPQAIAPAPRNVDGGVEIAIGSTTATRSLDMTNSIVRLREDRISVRNAIQRMMDQIGGGHWSVVWDLSETNAALPDMEISVYAEEPFMNVLNALLMRLQSRSAQPLRVMRYDNVTKLIITDRQGMHNMGGGSVSSYGSVPNGSDPAVTESTLKEAMVSLHYDEIPLVDALENVVNQAGKGQWRLRVYAGQDQVLKPAHIEEPFSIAMDRVLRLFNLKYEIFPGGKLVVVTQSNRFGFGGIKTQ